MTQQYHLYLLLLLFVSIKETTAITFALLFFLSRHNSGSNGLRVRAVVSYLNVTFIWEL